LPPLGAVNNHLTKHNKKRSDILQGNTAGMLLFLRYRTGLPDYRTTTEKLENQEEVY